MGGVLASGPAQSVDGTVPKPDVPAVTSDYYSDSAREDVVQPSPDDPQIGQTHLPMGQQPAAPIPPKKTAPTAPVKKDEEVAKNLFSGFALYMLLCPVEGKEEEKEASSKEAHPGGGVGGRGQRRGEQSTPRCGD